MFYFSRWVAPVAGIFVGGLMGLFAANRGGPYHPAVAIAVGAAMGGMAGMVVWLIDTSDEQASLRPATALGWVLAVLAILTLCMPFFGPMIALPAFLVNRKAEGWAGKLSRLAFGVSVVISIVVLVAFNVPLGK